MRVQFRIFKGRLTSWETLFQEAADFTTALGPDRLISISHSEDHQSGAVTA